MRKLLFFFLFLLASKVVYSQNNMGKYIINGETYYANGVIPQLYDFGRQLPDAERPFLSCIIESLKNGKTIKYDPLTYTISGDVPWESALTAAEYKKYIKQNKLPNAGSRMIYHLAQFTPYQQAMDRIILHMHSPKHLTYIRNQDGTYRYFVSANNISAIDRLESLKKFKRIGRDIYFDGCIIGEFKGYNNLTKEIYMDWIECYKDLNGLIARVKNATITKMDEEVLKQIGIFVQVK